MSEYYDRDGRVITLMEWVHKFETDDEKIVQQTRGEDGTLVSTVWLGINHNWGKGPPLIFETMVFGGDHDGYQERHSTETEAIEGHEEACQLVFGRVV